MIKNTYARKKHVQGYLTVRGENSAARKHIMSIAKKYDIDVIPYQNRLDAVGVISGTYSDTYKQELKTLEHEIRVEGLMKKAEELHVEHSVTRYFKKISYPKDITSQKEALSYYTNTELSQVYRSLVNKADRQLGGTISNDDIDKLKFAVQKYGNQFGYDVSDYITGLEVSKSMTNNLHKGQLYREILSLGSDKGYSLEDYIRFTKQFGNGYVDTSLYDIYMPTDKTEYPINKIESIADLYDKIGEYSIAKFGRIQKDKKINSGVEFAGLKIEELFNAARVLGLTDDEIFDNLNKNMPDFERQLERLELAIYDKDMTREMWANLYIQLARAIDPTLKLANSQHIHNLANQWGSKNDETPTPSIARIRAARKSNNKVKQAFEAAKKSRNSRNKK